MSPLRDLEPRYDVKGGSPKTPIPIPLKNLEGYIETNGGSDGLWKAATTGACGLVIGMTVAWWTALQSKGMTQGEKEFIALQQTTQDEKIGSLNGQKERIFTELETLKQKHVGYDKDLADHDNKIKLLTNYIEAEKFPKK